MRYWHIFLLSMGQGLLLCWAHGEHGLDRMVVRLAGSLVDLTADSTEGRAVEDVVDAHDEGACLEGKAEAIASLDEGVLQPIGDLTTGIGEGACR